MNDNDAAKEKYLSTRKVLNLSDDASLNPLLQSMIERVAGIKKLNDFMDEVGSPWPSSDKMLEILFEKFNINWRCENPEILEQLDDRPKVFVANHPYGLPDAFALFQLLSSNRPNLKFFANKLLEATPQRDERFLFVDPFGKKSSRDLNRRSMASAMKHLRAGGDLALFPGRICSHLKLSDWTISDSAWTDQVKKFVETSKGEMVPIFISGRNSMLFNLSGLIHPRIRTYMLLNEFLRGGHDFTFKIGEPVTAEQLNKVSKSMSVGAYSRSLVYALKTGATKRPDIPHLVSPQHRTELETKRLERKPVTISGDGVKALLEKQELLFEHTKYKAYHLPCGAPKDIMDVICEVRFQAYQDSTDFTDAAQLKDKFDDYYQHILLWDEKAQEVIGTYRCFIPLVSRSGKLQKDLVTAGIFDLKPKFIDMISNALELGRAAIIPDHQKQYLPLSLLWRGVLEVIKDNKDIRYLFGPVTMGQQFSPVSRELLQRFVMNHMQDDSLIGLIKPKRPLDLPIPREVEIESMEKACKSFLDLGHMVEGIEGGKRQLPVLFKHYANVGSKYIGFGEWKDLDMATAGITVLDFNNAKQTYLKRYFGSAGAEEFMAGRS